MRMTGDQGARTLLAAHPVVEVPCDGTGEATDVDTPADLAAAVRLGVGPATAALLPRLPRPAA
jgi:2-phospho-L-lactate guanylyltransferase